jgi:hypothetical protein
MIVAIPTHGVDDCYVGKVFYQEQAWIDCIEPERAPPAGHRRHNHNSPHFALLKITRARQVPTHFQPNQALWVSRNTLGSILSSQNGRRRITGGITTHPGLL